MIVSDGFESADHATAKVCEFILAFWKPHMSLRHMAVHPGSDYQA